MLCVLLYRSFFFLMFYEHDSQLLFCSGSTVLKSRVGYALAIVWDARGLVASVTQGRNSIPPLLRFVYGDIYIYGGVDVWTQQ